MKTDSPLKDFGLTPLHGFYGLDEKNNPIELTNLDEAGKWFESEKRIVCQTKIGNKNVSTCFMVLCLGRIDGIPLLFETMIDEKSRNCEIYERYTTWDAAEKGHKRAVEELKHEKI